MALKFKLNDRVVIVESDVETTHPLLRGGRFIGTAGVLIGAEDYRSDKFHNDYRVKLDGDEKAYWIEEPFLMLETEYWRLDNVSYWRKSAEDWSQIGRNYLVDGNHAEAAICFNKASQDMCRSRNHMHYLDAVA